MSGDVTGGSFPLAGDLTVTRMGFGAMQLAGPGVWGRLATGERPSGCCGPSPSWG